MKNWFQDAENQWGKKANPRIGIIDSQSIKNTQRSEVKGYDAGKKIKGIKRHSYL
ncbi:transposase [Rickettsia endosymbiont of Ceutorhynchus obstrictus]|uniref:transposase n=1 Tax=unclassified Rickettsia TaxID=114295 RepID=UPI00397E1317